MHSARKPLTGNTVGSSTQSRLKALYCSFVSPPTHRFFSIWIPVRAAEPELCLDDNSYEGLSFCRSSWRDDPIAVCLRESHGLLSTQYGTAIISGFQMHHPGHWLFLSFRIGRKTGINIPRFPRHPQLSHDQGNVIIHYRRWTRVKREEGGNILRGYLCDLTA